MKSPRPTRKRGATPAIVERTRNFSFAQSLLRDESSISEGNDSAPSEIRNDREENEKERNAMAYFDWDAKYETGVMAMDAQHRKLIQLMNRLHEESGKSAGRATLLSTLDELGAFTAKHFREEENYMASIRHSSLPQHKEIHTQLLNTYKDHVENFKKAQSPSLPSPFFTFLKLWLSSHILGIDSRHYGTKTSCGAA